MSDIDRSSGSRSASRRRSRSQSSSSERRPRSLSRKRDSRSRSESNSSRRRSNRTRSRSPNAAGDKRNIFISLQGPRSYDRSINERDLENFLVGYGRILSLRLIPGKSHGFAKFQDERDAIDAVNELSGRKLLGRKVVLDYCQSNRGGRNASRRSRSRSRVRSHSSERRQGRSNSPQSQLFIGFERSNTAPVEEYDLRDFFDGYGKIRSIKLIHGKNYGFVDFEDHRNAADALKDLARKKLLGRRITLQPCLGRRGRR